jgi:hypothetical protein
VVPNDNLIVRGEMQVSQDLVTSRLCDDPASPGNPSGLQSCFDPILLAGPETNTPPTHLRCDDPAVTSAPTGIVNSQIRCVTPDVSCPAPRVAVGVDVINGYVNLVCEDRGTVICPTVTRTVCGTLYTLPASRTLNTTHRIPATDTVGLSRYETFRCNSGGWSTLPIAGASNTGGTCACVPETNVVEIASRPCRDNHLSSSPPWGGGTGWTGTYTVRRTTTCGPMTVTRTNNAATQCTCTAGTSAPRAVWCPVGQIASDGGAASGNISQKMVRDVVTCSPYSHTVIDDTSCVCGRPDETQTRSCHTDFFTGGLISERRSWNCVGVPRWNPWVQTSNTCACKPNEVTTSSCAVYDPAKYNSGSVTKTCTYNCDIPNNTGTKTCTDDTSSCGCIESTRNLTCPEGYEPTDAAIGYKEKVTCAGNEIDRVEIIGSCKPERRTCTFRSQGGVLSTQSSKTIGNFAHGDQCTYDFGDATSNCLTIKRCYRTVGTNMYDHYRCDCI